MPDTPVVPYRFPGPFGLRRLAALCLLLSFGAAAMAPHQHALSLEDSTCDGPSDPGASGEQSRSQDPPAGPEWSVAEFQDDDLCLTCFDQDFDSVTPGVAVFALARRLGPSPQPPEIGRSLRSASSRAPPVNS